MGAGSAAAACGIQAQVVAEHFRMLSEQTLQKYDRVLAQERGAVSRARAVTAALGRHVGASLKVGVGGLFV